MSELLQPNSVVDSCESTNDVVKKFGESGLPHGTWFSSLEQTRGRGRLGRTWVSQKGNLFLSILIRDVPMGDWTWVPMSIALAVRRAIRTLDPTCDLRVKWPNDLGFLDPNDPNAFLKVGGILCESVATSSGGYIVAGIGINCEADVDTDRASAKLGMPLAAIRSLVVREIQLGDFSPTRVPVEFWESSWKSRGQMIEFESLTTGRVDRGEIIGLGVYGELVVRLMDGSVKALLSEEVRVSGKVQKSSS